MADENTWLLPRSDEANEDRKKGKQTSFSSGLRGFKLFQFGGAPIWLNGPLIRQQSRRFRAFVSARPRPVPGGV